MLKLKQQLLFEARHKKGKPRSAPITPRLERLRQEDHRFEPSLGSVIKFRIEEKGDKKEREEGRRKGCRVASINAIWVAPFKWELLQANGKSD